MTGNHQDALDLLTGVADELTAITRAKDFGYWQQEASLRLDRELARLPPFDKFDQLWVHGADGAGMRTTLRLGDWAISGLLHRKTPGDLIAAFEREQARNAADYDEVTPILGINIDEPCDLGGGTSIIPAPVGELQRMMAQSLFMGTMLPEGTAILRQSISVAPAFDPDPSAPTESTTSPAASDRSKTRELVRFACLLASRGPVELPMSMIEPHDGQAFVIRGQEMAQLGNRPVSLFPVSSAAVRDAFSSLRTFSEKVSLHNAIDRLGRSRLARDEVDRALDLGMAAEIAMMHDHGDSNTEIAHKIALRAAWLLGENAEGRAAVFAGMKRLYAARSQAVHNGALKRRNDIDLSDADDLVSRALSAILARGAFPDWTRLTLGGAD